MTAIVTGAAGFIGSNLVDRLLADGQKVVGVDNFSSGQRRFLEGALKSPDFTLHECDLLDLDALKGAVAGGEIVFHLAANADVRFGGFEGTVFRFVSILGERYTHGHVFDFMKKLKADPSRLHMLGDGKQRKSYLYIQDCIDAIFTAVASRKGGFEVFNLGVEDYCEVRQSAGWISERLGVSPEFTYEGGERGWIGDNPFIYLSTAKINALGWTPKLSIREAVLKTVDYLQDEAWVLEARD